MIAKAQALQIQFFPLSFALRAYRGAGRQGADLSRIDICYLGFICFILDLYVSIVLYCFISTYMYILCFIYNSYFSYCFIFLLPHDISPYHLSRCLSNIWYLSNCRSYLFLIYAIFGNLRFVGQLDLYHRI